MLVHKKGGSQYFEFHLKAAMGDEIPYDSCRLCASLALQICFPHKQDSKISFKKENKNGRGRGLNFFQSALARCPSWGMMA